MPGAKYAQKCAHSHPWLRLFTVPKSMYRPHRWAARVHFTAKDRHKATVLGLTWHASLTGTSIEIYLAPGWSGQGVWGRLIGVQGSSEEVQKRVANRCPNRFTALFTARDGGVPVGSAAGCGPFPTCYRSHKLLGHSRGHGRDLERRQFSPVKTEVISVTLR